MRGGVILAPAFAKPTARQAGLAKPAARQAVLGLDGVRGEGTDRTYGTDGTYMIYERGGSILGAGGCGASAAPVTFGFEDEERDEDETIGEALNASYPNKSRGMIRRFWWFCRIVFSAKTPLK